MTTSYRPVKYLILTPVRDEEEYIRRTIESVISQTIRPAEWIIVNDGSIDRTGAIIDDYAHKYSWIRVIHRPDRGYRKSGAGVIEAFYDGYRMLRCTGWEFIVKLDGDMTLPPDYFEMLLGRFWAEERLGIAGGTLYSLENGAERTERAPAFHVRGATKIYRRACWEEIGGLVIAPGWDAVDEAKANMLGWTTRTFPEIRALHHRFTGSADGHWRSTVKDGRADYVAGYHPVFMLAKCVSRFVRKPYLLGPLGLLYGYVSGYLMRLPQVADKELIRYVRRHQLARLSGRETFWK